MCTLSFLIPLLPLLLDGNQLGWARDWGQRRRAPLPHAHTKPEYQEVEFDGEQYYDRGLPGHYRRTQKQHNPRVA